MSTTMLGLPVAKSIDETTIERVRLLKASGIEPTLAIVKVGAALESAVYQSAAVKKCAKVGVKVEEFNLSETISEDELISQIESINSDPNIHGCLLLLPLPGKFNEYLVKNRLSPAKDVDGITEQSISGVFTGNKTGFLPCTAEACLEMIDFYGYSVAGKRAAVVGRSLVIGKPLAMELLSRNATVTMCHSRTADLEDVLSGVDFIFAAAGKRNLFDVNCLKKHQVIVDVGINDNGEGGICGDVDFAGAESIVSAITPVPRGVGSITTSVLAKHVVSAASELVTENRDI